MKKVKEYLRDALNEKLVNSDRKGRIVVSTMHVEESKYCDRESWKFAVESVESDDVEKNLMVIAYYVGEALFYIAAEELGVQEKAVEYNTYREKFDKEKKEVRDNAKAVFLREYTKNFNQEKEFKEVWNISSYLDFLERDSKYISPRYIIALMDQFRKGEANNTFSLERMLSSNPKHLMWKLLCLKCDVTYDEFKKKYSTRNLIHDGPEFDYSILLDALNRLVIFCYNVLNEAEEGEKEYFNKCIENAREVLIRSEMHSI